MIRLRAVGECSIEVGEERLGPDAELAFAVLLVLVLANGRPVVRRQLVDLLWPATSEPRARHNLRQTLYKLRQLGVPLEAELHDVRLRAECLAPDPLLHADADAPPPAELLRPDAPFGEFLAGYAPTFSAAFARWVDEQRAIAHGQLRRLVLGALLDERRSGSWGRVETLARKALQLDPLNEEATLALAEATALTGSKRAALAILDSYLDELGGDDGMELRLPAALLRRRIDDRLLPAGSLSVADTVFVGRSESMAVLSDEFRQVRHGTGRAVLLWGEQGIGKSRLVAEFAKMAGLEGAQVVRVPCQARDVERPLSIFVDGVSELLLLPGALGCSPESMAHLKRLTDHDPTELEPSEATREAELLFAGVRQAILDLLDAVASEAPLVLWVDDVHWLDAQSWRVLREVIEWLAGRALFVVLTSRLPHATPAPPGRSAPSLAVHRVPPLSHSPSLLLLDAVTGSRQPPAAFRDWCLHVAGGNPFYLRSLGQHWLEHGELRAPASLRALITERLSRLPDRPTRTLQACAVLGKHATLARLEAVLEYRRHELIDAVAMLASESLLLTNGSSVPCKHDLIEEAAVSLLADASRRLLHRLVAHVLEKDIDSSQSASLLWDCAEHWRSAGENDRALALIRSCAAHLLEVGLHQEAADVYDRAVDLCESDADKLDMLERLKNTQVLAGQWAKLPPTIERIVSLKYADDPELNQRDPDNVLLLEAEWSSSGAVAGLPARALSYANDRKALPQHRLRAATLALVIADNACDGESVSESYRCVQHLLQAPGVSEIAAVRFQLVYHTSHGSLTDACELAPRLVSLARQESDIGTLMRSLRFAALAFRRAGRFAEAESFLREACDLGEKYRLTFAVVAAVEGIILNKLDQEAVEEATLWYDHAASKLREMDDEWFMTKIAGLGVRLALEENDLDLALVRYHDGLLPHDSDPALRRRAGLMALHVKLAVARGQKEDTAATVGQLARTLAITGSWGGQDYAASCLLEGMRAVGRSNEGETAAQHYVGAQRRELFPPPAPLRHILAAKRSGIQ